MNSPRADATGEMVDASDRATLLVDPEARRYAKLFAKTLIDPDEIWYEWTDQPLGGDVPSFHMASPGIVRRYIARFKVDEEVVNLTVLTTVVPEGWAPREFHATEAALSAARRGHLAYRKL